MGYPEKTILSRAIGKIQRLRRNAAENRYGKKQPRFDRDMAFSEAASAFPDPNELYAYLHHYFHHFCPQRIRDHRNYFKQNRRGFGEDAFHAMWYLLLSENKPKRMLEIGVYRGQVVSLWTLISEQLHLPCEAHGISPFASTGDSILDAYPDLDYMTDVVASFEHWGLPLPTFVKAKSCDPEALQHIKAQEWDLIYIDGDHSFEGALADYEVCRDHLKAGGILVMDDASLHTSFRPPPFSSPGHPGPSRVAREYADKELKLLAIVGHNNVYRKPSS